MRPMLDGDRLSNNYWSSDLSHAVYLKDRLQYTAISTTLFEMYTSKKPDISHLRVFGRYVTSKNNVMTKNWQSTYPTAFCLASWLQIGALFSKISLVTKSNKQDTWYLMKPTTIVQKVLHTHRTFSKDKARGI